MVGEQGDRLVEVELRDLRWRLDVVLGEVGPLAARPVVEPRRLEERVLGGLQGAGQARIGDVLLDDLADRQHGGVLLGAGLVRLLLGPSQLIPERAAVTDDRGDRGERTERGERAEASSIEGRFGPAADSAPYVVFRNDSTSRTGKTWR